MKNLWTADPTLAKAVADPTVLSTIHGIETPAQAGTTEPSGPSVFIFKMFSHGQ